MVPDLLMPRRKGDAAFCLGEDSLFSLVGSLWLVIAVRLDEFVMDRLMALLRFVAAGGSAELAAEPLLSPAM